MNYKEKYEMALETIQEILESGSDSIKMSRLRLRLQSVFPEIRESKDERIRKEIIKFLELPHPQFVGKRHQEDWLAWLEKQGECHISHDDEIMIKQLTEYFTTGHGLQNTNETVVEWLNDVKEKLEKRGEIESDNDDIEAEEKGIRKAFNKIRDEKQGKKSQRMISAEVKEAMYDKSAEEVEPKFKEGEWLCENEPNNYARFIQILEIVNVQGKDRYRISRDIHKDEDVVEFGFVEKYYHKFDIQDAKDGDVLAAYECFVLFKKLDGLNIRCYCTYHYMNNPSFHVDTLQNKNAFHPATKEQRDTLMKAMTNAGYTFDFEKKELKLLITNGGDFFESENCEQKPADTVEPKFKAGDWIVFNGFTLYIKEVVKGFYRTISKGGITNSYDWDIDNAARLWTIQDAKEGDVLINDFHLIFIFKEIKNNMYISHCSIIDRGNDVIVNSVVEREVGDVNLVKCQPVTKEQYDLLFSKMKEAGYEWDADKKELKKFHIIDEGKAEMDYCFTKMMNGEKVSSAWSEEDEKMLVDAYVMLDWYKGNNWWTAQYIKDWLKSLKERCTWKPNDTNTTSGTSNWPNYLKG